MPHLLNFIKGNGTLLTNDHTVADLAHGDRDPDLAHRRLSRTGWASRSRTASATSRPTGTTRTGVSFAYWTAPLFDPAGSRRPTPTPEMINENGKIAPAPWVPYTRAGCDFGAVATANTILENTAIDIPTVFGAGSPEARRGRAPNPGAGASPTSSASASTARRARRSARRRTTARPDLLPDEPGGYSRLQRPLRREVRRPGRSSRRGPMTDLNGNVDPGRDRARRLPRLRRDGGDGLARPGSRRCRRPASRSRTRTSRTRTTATAPPATSTSPTAPARPATCSSCRTTTRRSRSSSTGSRPTGSTRSNTLFVFTVDEGDHFVGDAPTPAGCDGVTTPCTYNRVGEINADLRRMIRHAVRRHDAVLGALRRRADRVRQRHSPAARIRRPGRPQPRARDAPAELAEPVHRRGRERHHGRARGPVEMKTLHMVTADPFRTPTFTPFADPDWFFFATAGSATCATPAACASIPARTSRASPGTTATSRTRSPRPGSATSGRACSNLGSTARRLDGPHRRAADDADPARPPGRLRPRRPRRSTQAARPTGRCRSAARAPWRRCIAARRRLQAAERAVRLRSAMDTLVASTRRSRARDDTTYNSIENADAKSLTSPTRRARGDQIGSALDDASFGRRQRSIASEAQACIRQAQSLIDQRTHSRPVDARLRRARARATGRARALRASDLRTRCGAGG